MPFHDVQQGDTLIGIAAKNGLKDYTSIADHSDNATLKQNRPDPGILQPGDRVFIPNREMLQHPSAVDASHKFKLTRPKAWLRVAVKDSDGNAFASKAYVLTVGSKVITGTTDASGVIEQVVLEAKYAGYIDRQAAQVERFQRLESKPIPAHFDYTAVPQLRAEAKEKLARIRPASVGQASRISGSLRCRASNGSSRSANVLVPWSVSAT